MAYFVGVVLPEAGPPMKGVHTWLVYPRNERQPPTIDLEPSAHPLSVEYRGWISLDHIVEPDVRNGREMNSLSD